MNAPAMSALYNRLGQTLENCIEEWDVSPAEVIAVLDVIKSEMNKDYIIITSDSADEHEDEDGEEYEPEG